VSELTLSPESGSMNLATEVYGIGLTEGNAKYLRRKSNMHKEFAAAVYLSEAPSLIDFCFGWSSNL
jgi:hypothetical protein